jgi:DNA-binding NtrC family response regulator
MAENAGVTAVILVIDDDDPVRIMVARLLRLHGYQVLEAASVAEGKALLAKFAIDLVVSDIVMPGESGIEMRRTLAERRPDLPFILISGYSADEPAAFAARTPGTTFIQKPFSADQLVHLVAENLAAQATMDFGIGDSRRAAG